MARNIDSAKRVINGTFGELWKDGVLVAETTACQAKITKTKTAVQLCGQMMEDTKTTSVKGTGSLTIHKVDSAWISEQMDVQNGVDSRHTLVSALKDPDSWGAERISLSNVSFDDVTLADWKAATMGSVTIPFTFTGAKLLDAIEEG